MTPARVPGAASLAVSTWLSMRATTDPLTRRPTLATKITITDLLDAGVHFGHPTRRWNPKMKPYIHSSRNGIYIIDLSKTMRCLADACKFLFERTLDGGTILFVGTKRQAQEAVAEAAQACGQYYMCERWLGGTLTNNQTIRKSIGRMRDIQRLQDSGELDALPKKEGSSLRREHTKLHKNLAGIESMRGMPDVMVVVDTVREEIAVREAQRLGIPVVGIMDTNSDPDIAEKVIPANDDAGRSIKIMLDAISQSVGAARQIRVKKDEEVAKAKAEAEAAKAKAKADAEAEKAAERAAAKAQKAEKANDAAPAAKSESADA